MRRPFVPALVLSALSACCFAVPGLDDDPCSSHASCDTCVSDFDSVNCRWCPTDQKCAQNGNHTRCGSDGALTTASQCESGAGGGSGTAGGSGRAGGNGGTAGGSSTPTGACTFYDFSLNAVLCDQMTASSCAGKFFGNGTSCASIYCPQGSSNPNNCTVGPGGTGGGSGGTGGGSGSTLKCGRYTVVEAGSSSSPGTGVILDNSTGFRWTRYAYSEKTQPNAVSFCQGLGKRLPSRSEAGALSKCCEQRGTVNDCNVAFPGVWSTWTSTLATSGNAYYATTPGFTCLPADCINPTTSMHAVMCLQQ